MKENLIIMNHVIKKLIGWLRKQLILKTYTQIVEM